MGCKTKQLHVRNTLHRVWWLTKQPYHAIRSSWYTKRSIMIKRRAVYTSGHRIEGKETLGEIRKITQEMIYQPIRSEETFQIKKIQMEEVQKAPFPLPNEKKNLKRWW